MYVCAQCLNRFRMYDEDEERHTETCPHCGSEYFDHYSDEDEDEDGYGDGDGDEEGENGSDAYSMRLVFDWTGDDLDDEYFYNYDND